MNQYRFASIFGKDWEKLPAVLKKFYAVCDEKEATQFSGSLNVTYKLWIWLLRPFVVLLRLVIPTPGKNIQIDGKLKLTPEKDVLQFNRDYGYKTGKKLRLYSNWEIQAPNRIIEFIGNYIGWRFTLSCDSKKVILTHDAFVVKLFGKIIRLPLYWLVVGKGYAEQIPINDSELKIKMTLTHFLFGEYYVYEGTLNNVI